ncbi:MAG TPA: zinc ribbon domain-containing protein [Candidatus Deferrimicrobium sp.]|nr:zinc ribbon domain-containing protein [Candidatus Deferrimicrobium sp.]
MTKSTKEFDMGNIAPQELYDLLVKIFIEPITDAEMKYRLNISLDFHTILTQNPFLAKIRLLAGSQNDADVSCYISCNDEHTILKIESIARYPSYGYYRSYGYVNHKKIINNIYDELKFRLDNIDTPSIKDVLTPDEKIIKDIFPITYQDNLLKCTVTDSRLLLSHSSKVLSEINHQKIVSITSIKEKYVSKVNRILFFIGIGWMSFIAILLIISLVLSSYPGIIASIIQICFALTLVIPGYLGYPKFYLRIQVGVDLYQLESKKSLIADLENTLKGCIGQNRIIETIKDTKIEKSSQVDDSTKINSFCTNCGAQLPSDSIFCDKCGSCE